MTGVIAHLVIVFAVLIAMLGIAASLTYVERRLLALWQDRYGPNRAGPFGLLQVVADAIKMLFKEDWVPPFADKLVFVIAPGIIIFTVLMAFVVVPFAPGIQVVSLNIGLLSSSPWPPSVYIASSLQAGPPAASTHCLEVYVPRHRWSAMRFLWASP